MTFNRDLHDEVARFAVEITKTVQAVLGHQEVALKATILDDLVRVATETAAIPLRCRGEHVLTLKVNYYCGWDSSGQFLAIHRSEFHVLAADQNEPLLRFEFDRNVDKSLPVSHLHVHAHRDAATWAMMRAGTRTERSRRRGASGIPSLKDLHLPLGGKRFRPSLEDIMQMLVEEFGVDAVDGWKGELARGRAEWRRLQVRAATRDAPEEAASVLRDLGYEVARPTQPDDATIPVGSLTQY